MSIEHTLVEKQKARIVELEQELHAVRSGVGQDHVDKFLQGLDGFMLLVQQAERGEPTARAQAGNFVRCLDRARAVAINIALPGGS